MNNVRRMAVVLLALGVLLYGAPAAFADDGPPVETVELSVGDVEVSESAGFALVPISITAAFADEAWISGAYAKPCPDPDYGSDEFECDAELFQHVFAPGQTQVVLRIDFPNDDVPEPNQTASVTVSSVDERITIVKGRGVVTILNDDVARTLVDIFDAAATGPAFVNAYTLGLMSNDIYVDQLVGDPSQFQSAFRSRWGDRGFDDIRFVGGGSLGMEAFAMRADGIANVVVFRGTEFTTEFADVFTDANAVPRSLSTPSGTVQVHSGFWNALDQSYAQLKSAILDHGEGLPLWITGNSLGSAMAVVAAMRLELDGVQVAGVHHFGGPRVGDQGFADALTGLVGAGRIQRWVDQGDPVTRIPGFFVPAGTTNLFTRTAGGTTLTVGGTADVTAPIDLNEHYQGRYNNNLLPHARGALVAGDRPLLPDPGPENIIDLDPIREQLVAIIVAMIPWYSVNQIVAMFVTSVTVGLAALVPALAAAGVAWDAIAIALAAAAVPLTVIVDQLFGAGANALAVAGAIFPAVTASVSVAVDQIYRYEKNFVELAGIIKAEFTNSTSQIAFQLQRIGANHLQLARALLAKVTQDVETIAEQLHRFFPPEKVAAALKAEVTQSVTAIVGALVALRIGASAVAAATYASVTTSIDTIVAALAPHYPAGEIAVALAALGRGATEVAAAIMGPLGLTYAQTAAALDAVTAFTIPQIVDALQALDAQLSDLAGALEHIGLSPKHIAAFLREYGAIPIAVALDDFTTATTQEIVNALEFIDASLGQIVDALQAMGRSPNTIVNALDDWTTASYDRIAEALDDFTSLSTDEIADKLDDLTQASTGEIIDALQFIGRGLATIAGALEHIGRSTRQIVEGLDDFTGASYDSIAEAVRDGTDATFRQIVDALDAKTSASKFEMAHAIRAAGAGFTTIMRALEDELSVSRYDTADILERLGADARQIISALIDVYDAGFDSVVDVMESIGFAWHEFADAICDFFNC